jgi:hypothetical protein
MRRIDGFNPAANAYVNRYSLRTNRDQMHMALFMVDHEKIDPTKYKDVFNIPKTWQEAWNHPDPWLHNGWREGITKELLKMTMCIKYKLVFDIKQDGTFCARLVACRYSQVP